MSDNYIRLIPIEPDWQPTSEAAAAATSYVASLFTGDSRAADEVRHEFIDSVTFIDSGVNTSTARCPACTRELDLAWVYDVIGERHPDLTDLEVELPCCGSVQSLNDLDYDWAVGFARFEITVLNGTRERPELDDRELDEVAARLRHPVRQVLAHY